MEHLEDVRRAYAEELRAVAKLRSEALVNAFASVPREAFLGRGPWQIIRIDATAGSSSEAGYEITQDDDPHHLYQNVLVAIDSSRNLNNGQPSWIAAWLDALELRAGERVLHVGCGVGYYTAIMAEVVGRTGTVVGVEVDEELAERARRNLASFDQVLIVHANGVNYNPSPVDAIFINAGVTHLLSNWLDGLRPGGRLLLPLTASDESPDSAKGGMLRVQRKGEGYAARFLSTVNVFSCVGCRDDEFERPLRDALKRGNLRAVKSLRRERHEADESCWLHNEGCCLSTLPVEA
jgi:protein-L-isoaspartate(D-aspartate) O-methyltransferase